MRFKEFHGLIHFFCHDFDCYLEDFQLHNNSKNCIYATNRENYKHVSRFTFIRFWSFELFQFTQKPSMATCSSYFNRFYLLRVESSDCSSWRFLRGSFGTFLPWPLGWLWIAREWWRKLKALSQSVDWMEIFKLKILIDWGNSWTNREYQAGIKCE